MLLISHIADMVQLGSKRQLCFIRRPGTADALAMPAGAQPVGSCWARSPVVVGKPASWACYM
jgi:hypothetical protein